MSNSINSNDPFLESLLFLAENGVENEVTIQAGGYIIRGVIISYNEFYESYTKQIPKETLGDERTAKSLAQSLGQLDKEGDETVTVQFVSLRDVSLKNGVDDVSVEYWRVPVKAIDGWKLGTNK